jgi:hypothetical protein
MKNILLFSIMFLVIPACGPRFYRPSVPLQTVEVSSSRIARYTLGNPSRVVRPRGHRRGDGTYVRPHFRRRVGRPR